MNCSDRPKSHLAIPCLYRLSAKYKVDALAAPAELGTRPNPPLRNFSVRDSSDLGEICVAQLVAHSIANIAEAIGFEARDMLPLSAQPQEEGQIARAQFDRTRQDAIRMVPAEIGPLPVLLDIQRLEASA